MHKCISFQTDINGIALPAELNDPFDYEPHALCQLAAVQVQDYLSTQQDFNHNFGLGSANEDKTLKPIGKMFGVLVVRAGDTISFLAAFSGKLAGANAHAYFVPPVYDSLAAGSFLTPGMLQLKAINTEIQALQAAGCKVQQQVLQLKAKRRAHSQQLQSRLFDAYRFLNAAGDTRTPKQLFHTPPAGAGECAAPKLLQYAFQHHLQPLAMAEFWYGVPPSAKQTSRDHLHFYPACEDKCSVVLGWMLG